MTRIASLSFAAAAVLTLSSIGCEKESKPPAEPPQTTGASTSAPGATYTLSDTFGALRAIHAGEIEEGSLAEQKATDPRVKAFAEKVVKDHKARMTKDARLMSAMGISATDNAVSEQIKSYADDQTSRLNELSGMDFDRAYIEDQVNYYRRALDVFDRDLLPNAQDPQIRGNLTEARSRANDHLKEAQDLRVSLVNKQ